MKRLLILGAILLGSLLGSGAAHAQLQPIPSPGACMQFEAWLAGESSQPVRCIGSFHSNLRPGAFPPASVNGRPLITMMQDPIYQMEVMTNGGYSPQINRNWCMRTAQTCQPVLDLEGPVSLERRAQIYLSERYGVSAYCRELKWFAEGNYMRTTVQGHEILVPRAWSLPVIEAPPPGTPPLVGPPAPGQPPPAPGPGPVPAGTAAGATGGAAEPVCRSFRMTRPFSVRPSFTGLIIVDVGGMALTMTAEEYAAQVDQLDALSQTDCMPPINVDAAIPYNVVSGDYWHQCGYYYGICDNPPEDPRWFGSNPLPRPGTPTYDRDMLRCIAESRGTNSSLYRFRSRGIDPCPVGYVPVWVLEPYPDFRPPFDLRDPFRIRPEPQRWILQQRQQPVYGPWGWRARLNGPCEAVQRGGRLQQPGGVDPPFVAGPAFETASACACTAPGRSATNGWWLAIGALALAAWRRRRQ